MIYITNPNYKRGFRLRVCPFLIPFIEEEKLPEKSSLGVPRCTQVLQLIMQKKGLEPS